jgi:uncharacterized protein
MKSIVTALTLISLLVSAPSVVPNVVMAQGAPKSNPSFNCARARTQAERAICRIPALGAKDRAIASLYPRVVAATPVARRRDLAADQALFNRSREDCYTPEQEQDDCLAAIMTARVSLLSGWLRGGFR